MEFFYTSKTTQKIENGIMGVVQKRTPQKPKFQLLLIFQKTHIKKRCILWVSFKFQLNRTIIPAMTAFQRKSIILFGTVMMTFNTVKNNLGLAQVKEMGPMNILLGNFAIGGRKVKNRADLPTPCKSWI